MARGHWPGFSVDVREQDRMSHAVLALDVIQGLHVLEVCRVVGISRKRPASLGMRQRVTAEETIDLQVCLQ